MKEYKRTCHTCGAIWYFTENDQKFEEAKKGRNVVKALLGIGGHIGGTMPLEQMEQLDRCKECGSRNVEIVEVAGNTGERGIDRVKREQQSRKTVSHHRKGENVRSAPQMVPRKKRWWE